ncbi:hypothetical protein JEQ12_012878 [Ovis aries]|uniref:N-terminal Ras-GEF domain-containing protein n=1 Tax=Ovis aries TaxID=9940 RepID=A0A835ZMR2_SHEEP|nr:hypothetical protein JEQ12_012878 [Ovis aries]
MSEDLPKVHVGIIPGVQVGTRPGFERHKDSSRMENRASASGNPGGRGFSDVSGGSVLNLDASGPLLGGHLRQEPVHGTPCSISLHEVPEPHTSNRAQGGHRGESVSTGDRNETCRVWNLQRRRLETLVGKLVPAFLGGDPAYLPTFLGTYRAFGTPQQVLDLLFMRYGCILPYCDEDGGPLHQLKMAMTSILGTWLHLYPEDFQQSPEYPCLKMLLAYVELNMPDSDLEQRARHLLAQLETLKSTEAEGNAPPGEEALETSPDLTPSPPLSNPATAPQSRQAQSPAPIQVQDLHQGESVSTGDRNETCRVWSIQRRRLETLVGELVPAFLSGDSAYLPTFLGTYRAFGTPQQVLDLLFMRYGCILPYCDEDGGPLHQLKMAMASILGTWLHLYPEDFQQSPEFPCLKMLLAYIVLNMPGSDLEQRARHLLAQLETLEPTEPEGHAPAGEEALETSPDLTPSPPLINPATAPQSRQAQSPAPIQVQDLHQLPPQIRSSLTPRPAVTSSDVSVECRVYLCGHPQTSNPGNLGGRGSSDVSGSSVLNLDASGPLPGGHLRQELAHEAPCSISLHEGLEPHTSNRAQGGHRGESVSTGDRNETCRVWSIQRRRLETLVGTLVPAFLGGDSAYLPTFLGTYRAFGTPQQVLDLLFMRYGCILPYCDEDGGPLHQLKMAMASILGTWLHLYPEDFQQSPEFPCLKMLLAYVELNMPHSELEQQVRHLLVQLETLEPTEAEGHAPAGEEALETSPDLTPSPPLSNPATAPQSEQAQSPAPIQVQDLHQLPPQIRSSLTPWPAVTSSDVSVSVVYIRVDTPRHQIPAESVSTVDRNETCRVWSIQRRRLETLVGELVPAFLSGDSAYLPTFLGTYRAFSTPQQVLDLLFMRYGCILPYCDEDGGPLHQLKMAMASILGTWLHLYPEDFQQSPEFPCLKMLLAYIELNMPDSDLEQRARHFLAQLESLEPTEAEGHAPAGEEALETSPDLTPSPPLINPATAPQSEQAQSPAPIQVQDLHQLPPQIRSSLTPWPAVTSSDVSVSVMYICVDIPRHQIPGESVSTGDRNETCRVWSIQRRRLETLVGELVPAFLSGDSAYLPTFLGTYRAFGTPQQVLDLLFMRYGCILPYCDEDGGPLHQLKMAMASILGTWLHLYPEDFQQSPEFPCLKMLLAYIELNMPNSDLEQRARHLLAQLESLEPTEAEGHAPAGEEALETSPDLTPSPPLINPATAPQSRQAQSPAPIQVQDLHQLPPQIRSSLTPWPAVTSSDVSVSVVYIRVDTPRHQIPGESVSTGDRNETCTVWSIQRRRLETLVGKLVPAFLSGDSAYLPTFLGTYRAFGTPQQVLDLLFTRYGCILPYCDEDGGPLHQLKMAMASILGTWLHLYPEDFQQSPEFPCLKMLLAYVELNMPHSELEQQVRHLLAQLETLEPTEAEGHAPAGEEALETSPDLTPSPPLSNPATAPQSEQAQSPAPIQVQDLHQLPPQIRSSLTPRPTVTSSDVSVSVVYIRVDTPRHQIPGESVSTGERNETCRVWNLQRRRLEMLVGELVPAFLRGDPAYLPTFLGTYRAFGTPQQVLDLLFTRYGCILPYCDEDGGPLHQLKIPASTPDPGTQSTECGDHPAHCLVEPRRGDQLVLSGPSNTQGTAEPSLGKDDCQWWEETQIRSSLTPCPAVTSSDVSVSVVHIRVDTPRHQIPVSDHPAPWKSEKQASPGNQRRDVLVLTSSIKRSQSHTESGDKAISSFTYPPVACLNSAGLHRTSLLLGGRVHKPEAPESSPQDCSCSPEPAV